VAPDEPFRLTVDWAKLDEHPIGVSSPHGAPASPGRASLAAMPPKGQPRAQSDTRLAALRTKRGLTQAQFAEPIGLSIATYQRLEEGRMENPPIRYLANAAIALNVDLEEVCEPEWLRWSKLR
jgi:DNA-binding XRE family transcriptional regulator